MRHESAFLLRIWNDGKTPSSLRASLERVRTREVINFATLEELTQHLHKQNASKQTKASDILQ